MWVEERKAQFEAKQFNGGMASAIEIIQWLQDDRGVICVSWVPSYPKNTGYISKRTDDFLRIQTTDGNATIDVGEWIVKDPSQPPASQLLFITNETFDRKYKVVTDAGSPADASSTG